VEGFRGLHDLLEMLEGHKDMQNTPFWRQDAPGFGASGKLVANRRILGYGAID